VAGNFTHPIRIFAQGELVGLGCKKRKEKNVPEIRKEETG